LRGRIRLCFRTRYPVAERQGIAGIKPYRLIEVLDGEIIFSLVVEGGTPVVERFSKTGIEPDRSAIVFNGAAVFALI
jgi:hypothetical protein